jgi:hypothetical protein
MSAWSSQIGRPITSRKYENFIFFQFLANQSGDSAVFSMLRSLPTSGGSERQEQALAGMSGMADTLHTFGQNLLDGAIRDTGGGYITAHFRTQRINISGAGPVSVGPIPAFSLDHIEILFQEGNKYEITNSSADSLTVTGNQLGTNAWASLGPLIDTCEDGVNLTVLSTHIQPGQSHRLELEISEQSPDNDDPCDTPTPTRSRPGINGNDPTPRSSRTCNWVKCGPCGPWVVTKSFQGVPANWTCKADFGGGVTGFCTAWSNEWIGTGFGSDWRGAPSCTPAIWPVPPAPYD